MNTVRSRNAKAAVLQAAILALLMAVVPAVAQNNDGTTTNSAPSSNTDLLKGSEFENKPYNNNSNYAGMGDPVPLRKDAWSWYWNEKAQVPIDSEGNKGGFWGNDVISDFFRNISNSFVIPLWNGAMEYDFIRAALLVIIIGMLFGFGASFFLPRKPESK